MSVTSKKISRLEKEAFLRAKDFEYKREQTSHLLTNSCQDEEEFENDRHRRHAKMRQTRQIQREIDYQVGMIDKINDRRQQELQKKNKTTPTTTTSSTVTSISSPTSATSSVTNGAKRVGGATEKYTSSQRASGSKF
ncbi:unnamed protein product [Rotaria socialis]|uniref:Uncharacterized protein n=1 Tax=Rotaria socialis TaxID=392032 RepID=A0A817Q1T2_9BILA|nr:unnamed protein product [Rotaria socialis]CAF3299421.1 unnamed protein product [Rotaria socialis]CAF3362610.1 unnamed protein product [Rotaria socialis]CAF4472141.1 unnamed protein product [Rotaria socialis]CAF4669960.1 unnamed protein product [Rotaria socialis]